jgi:hypothetical protein
MVYRKAPAGHTEFGGGPGLIDPEARKDRALTAEESLMEIYATRPDSQQGAAGYDPATADLNDRVTPEPWPNKATAIGTVTP